MTTAPFLSICIPTYNRGGCIGQLLRTILDQEGGRECEIVISDNASSDGTAEVVAALCAQHPNIRYSRAATNQGADANFLRVVAMATGTWCWLMGSDDVVLPGAISGVSGLLAAHPEAAGASLNRLALTVDLERFIWERPVAGGRFAATTAVAGLDQVAVQLGEYLGYLSGQVVNRARWDAVVATTDLKPYYNAYVHVFVILAMVRARPLWLYDRAPRVGWRSGNDSFLENGILRRMLIDVHGYAAIYSAYFPVGSATWRRCLSLVATVHVRYALMGGKLNGASRAFFGPALRECVRTYWRLPAFWLRTFPIFAVPGAVVRALRWLYRRLLKPARAESTNQGRAEILRFIAAAAGRPPAP